MKRLLASWESVCAGSGPLRFIDINLRGVGQVMFQDNPLSGALFLAAVVKPMLYRLYPMCARKSCAAAGARMKPMTRLVAIASGTRNSSASDVLNRISEKTGASAAPKNAVLRGFANGSPLKRA